MKCKKCNAEFSSKHKDEDGVYHNMQNRKYCLTCSPFKIHNTIQLESKVMCPSGYKICSICKDTKTLENFSGGNFSYCKKCDSERVTTKQREVKRQCVEYKKGKCEICGYDKSISALQFHHLDPSKKDFSISDRHFTSMNEIIKSELDKCILVCANCHCEIHYGLHKKYEGLAQ
jgi:hypothetical protein